MTQEQYERIMKKIHQVENAARTGGGSYLFECISNLMEVVIEVKNESEIK